MSGGPLIAAAAATSSSSIWSAVERACRRAKSSGAIKTIGTQPVVTKQGLVLRVAEHLKDKPKPRLPTAGSERSAAAEPFDPFRRENLEEDLVVCDLGETRHTVLLNKFNVVDYHLLVVTRDYVSQLESLTREDYAAAFRVLGSYPDERSPGLAFYNCGRHSGMSQMHKHVQVVPMPTVEGRFPFHDAISGAIEGMSAPDAPCEVEALPFACYVFPLRGLSPLETPGDPTGSALVEVGAELERQYALAKRLCLSSHSIAEEDWSYNLLFTRDWWMLVPRSVDSFGPVGVNAMGFAGTFLVRTNEEMAFITQREDPRTILTEVGFPSSSSS